MTPSPHDLRARLAGGKEIPLVGLGTWQLTGDRAREAVGWALEAGYRHLDTAAMYGNESEVGQAVRDSVLPRHDVFITTKMQADRVGRERSTLERSLTALGTDHVDLWLVHWPPNDAALVDVWHEFVRARDDGLALAIGVSNYSLDQIDQVTKGTGVTPELNQVKWSPFLFDRSVYDGHRERGVLLEGYSPFRAARLEDSVLRGIADSHQATPAQVIVRWHIQREIVVIPKSSRRERIVDNVDVAGFELTDDEMWALDELGR